MSYFRNLTNFVGRMNLGWEIKVQHSIKYVENAVTVLDDQTTCGLKEAPSLRLYIGRNENVFIYQSGTDIESCAKLITERLQNAMNSFS